jgi:hypothetical protein
MSPLIRKQVRLATLALAGMLAFLVFGSGDAQAQNPHFVGDVVNQGITGTSDVVTGKVAGLGGQAWTVRVTADATALFACRNRGGNFPADPKKQAISAEVSGTARVTPDPGNDVFRIVLGPIGTTLTCPGGQVVVLACIQFANKLAEIVETGRTQAAVPSTVSQIFLEQFRAECEDLFSG